MRFLMDIVYIDEKFLFIGDANCGEFPSGIKDKELVDGFVATISSLDVDRCLEGHWTPDTLEGILDVISFCMVI